MHHEAQFAGFVVVAATGFDGALRDLGHTAAGVGDGLPGFVVDSCDSFGDLGVLGDRDRPERVVSPQCVPTCPKRRTRHQREPSPPRRVPDTATSPASQTRTTDAPAETNPTASAKPPTRRRRLAPPPTGDNPTPWCDQNQYRACGGSGPHRPWSPNKSSSSQQPAPRPRSTPTPTPTRSHGRTASDAQT